MLAHDVSCGLVTEALLRQNENGYQLRVELILPLLPRKMTAACWRFNSVLRWTSESFSHS